MQLTRQILANTCNFCESYGSSSATTTQLLRTPAAEPVCQAQERACTSDHTPAAAAGAAAIAHHQYNVQCSCCHCNTCCHCDTCCCCLVVSVSVATCWCAGVWVLAAVLVEELLALVAVNCITRSTAPQPRVQVWVTQVIHWGGLPLLHGNLTHACSNQQAGGVIQRRVRYEAAGVALECVGGGVQSMDVCCGRCEPDCAS